MSAIASLNSFVGRRRELDTIDELMQGDARLITLWGPPGVGKTRTAREFLRRVGPGLGGAFCDLSSTFDTNQVCHAVAQGLNAVLPKGATSPVMSVVRLFGSRDALVVLDNCEQATDSVAHAVSTWLQEVPAVKFLITTRERLRLSSETAVELLPFAQPSSVSTLMDSEVARLFVDRAQSDPSFEVKSDTASILLDVLARLEGIPLAIELAAARLNLLGLRGIHENLSRRLELLSCGERTAALRHGGLHDAIDWSWNLLSAAEKTALAWCSVFPAPFFGTHGDSVLRATVEEPITQLQSLRDKSLLIAAEQPEEPVRLSLLESVREFARGKLAEAGSTQVAFQQHAECYVHHGEKVAALLDGRDGKVHLDRLTRDLPHFVAITRRAFAEEGGADVTPSLGMKASLIAHRVYTAGTLGGFGGFADQGAPLQRVFDPFAHSVAGPSGTGPDWPSDRPNR